jgi:hypothetical protein
MRRFGLMDIIFPLGTFFAPIFAYLADCLQILLIFQVILFLFYFIRFHIRLFLFLTHMPPHLALFYFVVLTRYSWVVRQDFTVHLRVRLKSEIGIQRTFWRRVHQWVAFGHLFYFNTRKEILDFYKKNILI